MSKAIFDQIKCLIYIPIAISLISACSSEKKVSEVADSAVVDSSNEASWPLRMRAMAKNLENLFPYVASKEEFLDQKNTADISKFILEFERSVELIPKHAGEDLLGQDPIIKYSVSRLLENSHQAQLAFSEGHKEFARNLLKDNLGQCFSCHSTSKFGPENNFSTSVLSPNFRITPIEKANYYVATRQFGRALDSLENILHIPIVSNSQLHEQVGALQQYLALQVRVKKDPQAAMRTVNSFLNLNKLPYFVSLDVKAWKASLLDWQKELNGAQNKPARVIVTAKKIMESAGRIRVDEGYESGFVDYLRATSILHEGLRLSKKENEKSQIYQLLGRCYETLSKSGTWDLPEVYFESCIRSSPKSQIARQCFTDYERVTIMGFSGSAGVLLPKAEKERLNELREVAGVE